MSPTAGMSVGNNVRLIRPLAEGGMGSVWVASHLGLNTEVAVKFMSEAVARDAGAAQRFTREATAAAQIKSPHVVQVFDHGISATGLPYIVMELLEGEDLDQRVQRLGPRPFREVAGIIAQACKALMKAHAVGVVHRDIKPQNIFVTDSDGDLFVKLLDFGIAKLGGAFAAGATATGVVVGTPSYMSPEQVLSSKHVDYRSDIWSLGVVAYHCLTGSIPFEGETFGAIAVAIHQGHFAPVSALRPDAPPGIDGWFARAMAREPQARFASAKDMADALGAIVGMEWMASGSQRAATSVPPPVVAMHGHEHGHPHGPRFGFGPPPGAGATSPTPTPLGMRAIEDRGSGDGFRAAQLPPTLSGASVTSDGVSRRRGVAAILTVAALGVLGIVGAVAFLAGRTTPSERAAQGAAGSRQGASSSSSVSVLDAVPVVLPDPPDPLASASAAPIAAKPPPRKAGVAPVHSAPGHPAAPPPPTVLIPIPVPVPVPVPVQSPPPPPSQGPDRGF